ncbi:hypothetical protein MYA_5430 [Burkholderia sp. KJ006]|nr:hypothetical protein MYA_5430 [Burkholderia sp. KJ006]
MPRGPAEAGRDGVLLLPVVRQATVRRRGKYRQRRCTINAP